MVKMEKRKSFIFYIDWHEVLKKYPMSLRCKVYDAIIIYASSGELPKKLEGEALMAYNFIKEDIDRNWQKYEELCKRRREWAKMGGAPKGNQNAKKRNNLKVEKQPNVAKTTKTTINDNDNDIINNDNNIYISNNITTTTTNNNKNKKKGKIKNNLKVQKGETSLALSLFERMKNREISDWRNDFLAEFLTGQEERKNEIKEEFGSLEKAKEVAEDVLRRWENEIPNHTSIDNAFSHILSTMRIDNNVKQRKLKKYGKTRANSTASTRQKSGEVDRGDTPKESDYE